MTWPIDKQRPFKFLKAKLQSTELGQHVTQMGAEIVHWYRSRWEKCHCFSFGVNISKSIIPKIGAKHIQRPLYQVKWVICTSPRIHLLASICFGQSENFVGLPFKRKATSQCNNSCNTVPGQSKKKRKYGHTFKRRIKRPSINEGNWYSSVKISCSRIFYLIAAFHFENQNAQCLPFRRFCMTIQFSLRNQWHEYL